MALPGKNVVVQASTDNIVFNTILELNDVTFTVDGDNIDVTEFLDQYMNRIQGLKDVSMSMSGFWDPADTTGQVAIRNALVNDTAIFAQVLWDGTNGFKAEFKVSSFEQSAAVDGAVEVSIDLEGDGAVSAVP